MEKDGNPSAINTNAIQHSVASKWLSTVVGVCTRSRVSAWEPSYVLYFPHVVNFQHAGDPCTRETELCLNGRSTGVAHSAAAAAAAAEWGSFSQSSSSPCLPLTFNRAFISPTPLLTFSELFTCAQISEFSVTNPPATSGCVFQVFSPGLYWWDIAKSQEQRQAQESFHSMVVTPRVFLFLFYSNGVNPSRLHTFIQAFTAQYNTSSH